MSQPQTMKSAIWEDMFKNERKCYFRYEICQSQFLCFLWQNIINCILVFFELHESIMVS